MARLIDAEMYCIELYNEMNYPGRSEEFMTAIDVAIADLADAPTVDAVPVVRCKDCAVPHNKYTGCPELNGLVTPPDFFCPFGEQKKGERRMKAIKKSTLLELARIVRKYARTGDRDILSSKLETAKKLATQAYGKDNAWSAFSSLVDAAVGVYALYPKCTNEELCELFRALKFEVLDE